MTEPQRAAVETYEAAAVRLRRMAHIEGAVLNRPLMARVIRHQALIAQRAATAERIDPVPARR